MPDNTRPSKTGEKIDPTSNGSLPTGYQPSPPPPEESNRDHPAKVGRNEAVPGAGVEQAGARATTVDNPDRDYDEGKNPRYQKEPGLVPPVHIANRERREGVGSAESSAANGSTAPLSTPTPDDEPVGPQDPANSVPGINDPNYSAAKYPDGERKEKKKR